MSRIACGPRRRKALAPFSADTCAPTPTRTCARTQSDAHVGASVAQSRIGDPILYVDIRIGICIYCVYIFLLPYAQPILREAMPATADARAGKCLYMCACTWAHHTRSTPTESARTFWRGYTCDRTRMRKTQTHTRARARTHAHVDAHVGACALHVYMSDT